ncbi:MAG: molybdopterin molybdotransferase MoeA [candidate division Zixibacteria bacterium]|nr:molybdopterin molybdotransferase MoeA [candidate division Zixibacteria bacterium]
MISFKEATQIILDNVSVLPKVERSIGDVVGYCLAEDVVSGIDVISYRNSAMDGFAVCAAWLSKCDGSSVVVLPYRDTLFAGDAQVTPFEEGVAVKVMTGAPVPDGYDAVVRFEDTTYDDKQVTFHQAVGDNAYVRASGEDVEAGQKLFTAGDRLGPLDIGLVASIGLSEVTVYSKPSVLIATTGNELVPPGDVLPPGAVYNSNLYTIEAMVSPLSRSVRHLTGVDDSVEQLQTIMVSDADVIVTSGGVSAGERDLVIEAAEAAGFEFLLHKVRIKPGKPVYFARRGNQLLFGLPGNPLSTAVTCAIFVLPAFKKMTGWKDYRLSPMPARLSPDSIRKTGRMLIWPGSFTNPGGEIIATFSPKRSSAALSALLGSDGLIFQSIRDSAEPPTIKVVPWDQILSS